MAPDINPIYAGLERSCPWDSKNVSYRVFKKEGGKVEGYYTAKKCIIGAV